MSVQLVFFCEFNTRILFEKHPCTYSFIIENVCLVRIKLLPYLKLQAVCDAFFVCRAQYVCMHIRTCASHCAYLTCLNLILLGRTPRAVLVVTVVLPSTLFSLGGFAIVTVTSETESILILASAWTHRASIAGTDSLRIHCLLSLWSQIKVITYRQVSSEPRTQ
jgi:hypothetical protein